MRGSAPGLALAAIAASLLLAAGCGDDDRGDLTSEESLRDCLSEQDLAVEPSDLQSSASLGTAVPDFRVSSPDGAGADVVVEGSEKKAEKVAADVEGAKQSLGAGSSVVVQEENAVVVFEEEPPAEFREAIEGCVG